MPNWTTCAIATHKDNLDIMINENGDLDFEMLRPMPSELHLTEGGIQSIAVKLYKEEITEEDAAKSISFPYRALDGTHGDLMNFDDVRALGKRYVDNIEKYGYSTWYGWATYNWGTKWNAYETCIETFDELAVITFECAWSAPNPNMFLEAMENAPHPFIYGEAIDEDYSGIYRWLPEGAYLSPKDSLLFDEEHIEEDEGGYDYDEPICEINFAALKEMVRAGVQGVPADDILA